MRKLLYALALIALSNNLAAQVPDLISYQGYLTNSSGTAINGPTTMTFKFYNAASGGTVLWNSNSQSVTCTNGVFSVNLGAPPMPAIGPIIVNDTSLYLGIAIGADPEITPRTRISTQPYAYVAFAAGTAEQAYSVAYGGVASSSIQDGSIQFIDLGQNGATAGKVIKWNGSAWVAANDSVGGGGAYLPLAGGTMTGPITSSGSPAITMGKGNFGTGNTNSGSNAFVAGQNNIAAGTWSTIGGGVSNQTDAGYENQVIGGGTTNYATGFYSAVGGGFADSALNSGAAIGGGARNKASGENSTIGGGGLNRATNTYSFVGGGYGNIAFGERSSILGGSSDSAGGFASTVAGGGLNTAAGSYSFAAGLRAKARHDGCFVWGDYLGSDVSSTGINQFIARASGGFTFYTNGALSTGVLVPAGGGSWSSVSDRNVKHNLQPIEGQSLLDRLAILDIQTWTYDSQPDSIRHIGPMAQDFYRAFGVGEDSLHITSIDADGVALAAIQALYKTTEELKQKTRKVDELEAEVERIQALLEKLISSKK